MYLIPLQFTAQSHQRTVSAEAEEARDRSLMQQHAELQTLEQETVAQLVSC